MYNDHRKSSGVIVSQIHTCKVFNLNGRRISLTAGVKAGTPVVVLGVELSNHPALRDLSDRLHHVKYRPCHSICRAGN